MRFELIFMRIEDDNIICLEKKALHEKKAGNENSSTVTDLFL